jgi:N-acetylmuramoyl-L-alanine amidase
MGRAVLLALLVLVAAVRSAPAAGPRRVAISEDQLAAEVNGILYLELVASKGDSARRLAEKFAGSSKAASLIRAANDGKEPKAERFYRLPFEVLLDEHRRLVLAALFPEEIPAPPLEFRSDRKGRYAVYKLHKGEALYSPVVVRFTGRVEPREVNQLAKQIARRSSISNVRRIPAGHLIKIPVDLLLPEFQPPGSPGRLEVEAAVAAAARHRLTAGTARLAGVTVILDAGHGGSDSGAVRRKIYEDEHAYDVMVRIRELLQRKTAAHVVTTIRDRSSGYKPLRGKIWPDRDEYLLSDPPYDLRSRNASRHGVNTRWKIANTELERLRSQGVSADRVVFISLHADILHSSLRGAMVYVPGRKHRRALPKGVSRAELERTEGLSRALAREIIASLRRQRIRVHPYLPIRDHVIRSGRAWIPAVLRVSRVPHSVLVEIANLNNSSDRRLLVKTSFRQEFAEAVVDGLMEYYGASRHSSEVARRANGRVTP